MRYSIDKEVRARELAADGKSLDYIVSTVGVPKKVVIGWIPELRPHEDVIKWSVKQRFHSDFPEYEAVVSSEFSKFAREDITDEEWESLNRTVSKVMFDEAVHVFENAISDPPDFTGKTKLSDVSFTQFMRDFWNEGSSCIAGKGFSPAYIRNSANTVRYYSFLRNKSVKNVTEADLEILSEKLRSANLSEWRINFIIRAGRTALRYAYEQGMTVNRAYEFSLKKPCRTDYVPLTWNEAAELFSVNWKTQDAMLANFLAFTGGLKQNELRALRICDIGKDSIYVLHSFSRSKKLVPSDCPRTVVLSEVVITIIRGFIKINLGNEVTGDMYVFSKDGTSPEDIRHWGTELKCVCRDFGYDYESIDFTMWNRMFKKRNG